MIHWRPLVQDDKGFIPMLLALLIALGGLIGVGSLILSRSSVNLQSGKANLEQLTEIEKTIRGHAYQYRRLPCPANGDDPSGVAKATCTGSANDGVVPWGTLGLPQEAIRDPYGRLISYSVDPGLVDGKICTGATPNTPLPGAIRINPTASTTLFALVSHGSNGLGGWLPNYRQSAPPASLLERENCANSAANSANVTCADPDPLVINQGPIQRDPTAPDYFDDSVLAARSEDYTALCAAILPNGEAKDKDKDKDKDDDDDNKKGNENRNNNGNQNRNNNGNGRNNN